MWKNFLLFSFAIYCGQLNGQDIGRQYNFQKTKYDSNIFHYEDLKVVTGIASHKNSKRKQFFLYSLKSGKKTDSLMLRDGLESSGIIGRDAVVSNKEIFATALRPERLIKVELKTGKLSSPLTFNDDSIAIRGLIKNYFISSQGYIVSLFAPESYEMKPVFDFRVSADDAFKNDIGVEFNVGIGEIFSFRNGDKLLIKTGYNEFGASFACIYYTVDIVNGQTEKLSNSHFDSMLTAPRKELKTSLSEFDYKMVDFNVDIRKIYFDVSDSVGYIAHEFPYEEKIDSNHVASKTFRQDAFVVNRDFEIIGRTLERNIAFVEYPIYEKGAKKWHVISSVTDSLRKCTFRIKLGLPLETAFYHLYKGVILNKQTLARFDKYELHLLNNFIFAKYNYSFASPFYQAYFNTFSFYSNLEKKTIRLKNVAGLLSEVDKSNLAAISNALK